MSTVAPSNEKQTLGGAGSSRVGSARAQVLEARRLVARSGYEEALDLLEQAQLAATAQGDTTTLNEIGTVARLISIQTTGHVRRRAVRFHRQLAVVAAHEQGLGAWQLVVVLAWLVASGVVGATEWASDGLSQLLVILSVLFFAWVAYCVYLLGVLIFWAWAAMRANEANRSSRSVDRGSPGQRTP